MILILIGHNGTRDLVFITPALALLSAKGVHIICFEKFGKIYKKHKINVKKLFVIVITILLLLSFVNLYPTLNITFTAHEQAGEYLNDLGINEIYANNNTQMTEFYFNGTVYRFKTFEELEEKLAAGNITYVLIDTLQEDIDPSGSEKLLGYESLISIPCNSGYWKYYEEDTWECKLIKSIGSPIINNLYERMVRQRRQHYIFIYRFG